MRLTKRFHSLALALVVSLSLLACGSNSNLVASAGNDSRIAVGTAPQFDGCDSKGAIINYAWEIVETPAANQRDLKKMIRTTDSECSFILEADMQVDEVGEWVIELTVTDRDGDSDTDRVTVTVTN